MPRYLVERHFEGGLQLPADANGAEVCRTIVGQNGDVAVTWIHSYVTEDKSTTYCIYDGPNAEAIRKAASANGIPADRITKVSVLDPYFYH